ncbi:hypothetical protein Taro_018225 [Colocasia esculenta]|uniref:RST domain-containing protein n=1 Tax=Colocasia esculenta TaxID=4460 RepID=A0A843UT92_COLES|nr:hypothetical protein [Colocasia esculenta]
MDTIVRKLLEDDEGFDGKNICTWQVDNMHSGAAVEALTAALNRDIGMDMAAPSISQPSDSPGTLGALVTDSNSTTNQLIDEWQASNQEDQTAHQTVQLEEHKDLQAQEQYLTSVEQPNHQQNAQQQQQIDNQSENENLTVLQENLSTDQHQLQKDQVVEKNQVSISQENSVQESQRDKLQHSEDQLESFVQQLNDQQTSTSDQGNSQMRPMKSGTIPFTILIPILRPNLDKDRSMQLEAVFAKLRSNDISKEDFLRVIRNIVGDQMLRQAAKKIAARNSRSGSSPQQLQASQQQTSRGAQHFVESQSISHLHSLSSMQPQGGQTSTSVQQLVEESKRLATHQSQLTVSTVDVRPDMGSAKSNEVDNQKDTQGHHPAQVSSASMNVVKQEREVSLVSVQAVIKQQHHHPSSLLYGGTVNSHVFTRPPGSSSVTFKKSQSQGSQIRQLTPQGILPPQAGATQPTNMMNASMYEVQSTVTDANKHEGSVSHLTSHLSPLQSQVTWQSSTSKEQKASSLSTMSFVKQEVAEQTVEQKNRPQFAALQGSFGTVQIDPGSPALSSSKDETDEKQLSRTTFSSSASTMMTPQLESAAQVLEGGEEVWCLRWKVLGASPLVGDEETRSQIPSAMLPIAAGTGMKTPPKKPSVGQKKPFESQGTPPPASKKQKVSGAYHDQSIEQLNDVTAVSGVNLREEEEQLLSAPKEESRASEATRRVVQEEEEKLILLKGPLRKKLVEIMSKCGVKNMNSDVERCLSLCVEERLRGFISNLIRISRQRVDIEKARHRIIFTSDVRRQILMINKREKEDWERKQAEEIEKLRKQNEVGTSDPKTKPEVPPPPVPFLPPLSKFYKRGGGGQGLKKKREKTTTRLPPLGDWLRLVGSHWPSIVQPPPLPIGWFLEIPPCPPSRGPPFPRSSPNSSSFSSSSSPSFEDLRKIAPVRSARYRGKEREIAIVYGSDISLAPHPHIEQVSVGIQGFKYRPYRASLYGHMTLTSAWQAGWHAHGMQSRENLGLGSSPRNEMAEICLQGSGRVILHVNKEVPPI